MAESQWAVLSSSDSSSSSSSNSNSSSSSSSGHNSSSSSASSSSFASTDLPDSAVKLGSLLVDMDELDEAHEVFEGLGLSSHHTHKNHHHHHHSTSNNSSSSSSSSAAHAVLLLHRAELLVNKNEFQGAVALLRQAQKLVQSPVDDPWSPPAVTTWTDPRSNRAGASPHSNRTVLKQVGFDSKHNLTYLTTQL